jgi:hypothetical protein
MKFDLRFSGLAAILAITMVVAPVTASAQSLSDLSKLVDRRQDKKNEWRNIGIASGALGVLGLLKKDNTLFFAGAAGALYSANRYEQDRKSQSKLQRTKAAYFNRDGYRYTRQTKWKDGKKYMYFSKSKLKR